MKKAVIIGAGPAGLAAGDTLSRAGVETVILEQDGQVGGLSRTVRYKGYCFDIGGHRFYTKNKDVLSWWHGLLPHDFRKVRRRSRIYYKRRFFNYPLTLESIFSSIGFIQSLSIIFSYVRSRVFRAPDESGYEQWLVNRFGKKLYELFFKGYTRKVWGIEANRLSADVGIQRIKGLSLSEAVRNAFCRGRGNTTKTLIAEFHYPRLGAGMIYEAAASRIKQKSGALLLGHEAVSVKHDGCKITRVLCRDRVANKVVEVRGSDFCSSMPLTQLAALMEPAAPQAVLDACRRLRYRSVIMANCVVAGAAVSADNWIYVNSSDVAVARIQNFNNWSRDMVADAKKTSLAMEYFCDEGDAVWSMADKALLALAAEELERLKLCSRADVVDGCVVRAAKAYPVYEKGFAGYLSVIRQYVKAFTNLHCMGRYGLFHYNSMDHSVLTGFLAAGNVLGQHHDLWPVAVEAWND